MRNNQNYWCVWKGLSVWAEPCGRGEWYIQFNCGGLTSSVKGAYVQVANCRTESRLQAIRKAYYRVFGNQPIEYMQTIYGVKNNPSCRVAGAMIV